MGEAPSEQEVHAAVEKAMQMPLVQQALARIKSELPNDLFYHSEKHTHDVLREVLIFSQVDSLPERDVELLSIGAAFHDIGFIEKRVDNEWFAASCAREAMLAQGGYTESEVQIVESMILDTQLLETALGATQLPSTALGKYLLDADLGNLGRDDFFEKAELLRQEIGLSKQLFFKDAHRFLKNHSWHTPAAKKLREDGQQKNLEKLSGYLDSLEQDDAAQESNGLELSQLLILSRLPLLLNSSLNTDRLIKTALDHLKAGLHATAATVYQLNPTGTQLRFWALTGGEEASLANTVIPADQGVVGWVIQNRQAVLTNDPKRDDRFYSGFDKESDFDTVNMICVPLIVRSQKLVGAIQVLNKKGPEGFLERDLLLAERFANQLALAIDNAELFEQSEMMRKKLQQLDKRKGEMITVLTHELRTPLNVISGAADLLGNVPDLKEEMRLKMSDTLSRGVTRLVNLTQQLQSLARVQGEVVNLQKSSFPVSQLFESLEDRFQSIVEVRKQTLIVQGKDIKELVDGDEVLMFLALSNLIANAIRFTEDGGTITLAAEVQHGLVHFSVTDTGIGIAEEEVPNIFEKFYEVGDALVHSSGMYDFQSGGLGLGLSAVKAILTEHGSTISVESELGKGSTFSFKVPVKK